MFQDVPIRDDPLVIGDELIADGGGSDDQREESRNHRSLPRVHRATCRRADVSLFVYSHSIVAGGFELTS
jgi:hypothetical protein